jgi:erythromycin esterase-like protein
MGIAISREQDSATDAVRAAAHRLTGAARDYDPLLALTANARFVLLGEASHGTHDFYRARGDITKRLIAEQGFVAVVAEADWPDAYRVHRFVHGEKADADAGSALSGFKRFPSWMWRNADVLDFVGWLRAHNDARSGAPGAGFYGMDLYSLFTSMEAVLAYLDQVDPAAAERARFRYSCFDHYGEDSQAYGYAANFDMSRSCEDEVMRQLTDLQRRAAYYATLDGRVAQDEYFYAQQNARLVKNAEEYYRSMFRGRVSSWNLRDRHMMETLEALVAHLDAQLGRPAKIVVWAHNSHLGDARATDMGDSGEWNVGQLMRERYGREAVLIGFSTDRGTVTAASDWGGAAERRQVRPALRGSFEALFRQTALSRFFLILRDDERLADALQQRRLQRAIGVVYRPQSERLSHYFHSHLPAQFDAMIHFDETRAVEPLERSPQWEAGEEAPATFPVGV